MVFYRVYGGGDANLPMFHQDGFVVQNVGGCVVNVVKLW
jgi:hypothetical protein